MPGAPIQRHPDPPFPGGALQAADFDLDSDIDIAGAAGDGVGIASNDGKGAFTGPFEMIGAATGARVASPGASIRTRDTRAFVGTRVAKRVAMQGHDVPDPHYDRVAAILHWLIGLALLGQITFGFLLDDIAPRGTVSRAPVINLHKSFGMVLGALIVLRLAWRLAHRPPALPDFMPAWQRIAAAWSHRALYACMIVMPLSGYIGSNFSKYGVVFFGFSLKPWGPESKAVYAVFNGTHVVTAWIFSTLIVVHVAGALRHALLERDGVFRRMWPWGEGPGSAAREPLRATKTEQARSRESA